MKSDVAIPFNSLSPELPCQSLLHPQAAAALISVEQPRVAVLPPETPSSNTSFKTSIQMGYRKSTKTFSPSYEYHYKTTAFFVSRDRKMSEKMKILILSGDGIGPEIMAEAVRVIEAFRGLSSNIELYHGLLGGASIDQHGIPLTSEVSNRASDCNAVLLGPVGDPKWDGSRLGSESPQAGALQLRNQMNVFANLRPFTIPSWGLAKAISSYKSEIIQGVDFMIIRESHGESRFRRMEDNDFGMFLDFLPGPYILRC